MLRRRDLAGAPLPLTPPCLLEVRRVDAPSSSAPLEVVSGTLDISVPASPCWRLHLSAARTIALGPGRFEHRLIIGQAGGEPVIWARGYVTARDLARDHG
ncbi:MAG: hypothetical protein H7Y15_09535 [Pseudonocardia sp.]|nr:hypothetical protein [Pseudonocardia sp.]